MELFRMLGRAVGAFWRVLDESRRAVVNIIFLLIVVALLGVLTASAPVVPDGAALILQPSGVLVEELSDEPVDRALDRLEGEAPRETLLSDLIEAVDRAVDDERIGLLLLDLDGMAPSSLSKIQDLAAAVDRFRETGRPVVAAGDYFLQSHYALAAHADQIYLHPEGAVLITGYARYRNYFRQAIEKLEIDWNVFRVGDYKSFVEPYTRDDMSPEDAESSLVWMNELWSALRGEIEAARGLEEGTIAAYVDSYVERLEAMKGETGQLALDAGLVDALLQHDEVDTRIADVVGRDGGGFKGIEHRRYLAIERAAEGFSSGEEIAVIVASGDIVPGRGEPGRVGSAELTRQIRQVRDDADVAAVVLRVDSPGGSAFASDLILRELELLQQAGKPLVVSMSSVAASGGYWIAMGADEIWARPSTITGSIGIFAMIPTFEGTLGKLGISTDGVSTTELGGLFRLDRDLTEPTRRIIQSTIEAGYEDFVTKVAEHRGLEIDAVRELAGGRVWAGSQAQALGLVDELGGFEDAVAAAARLAGVESPVVTLIERPMSPGERLIVSLLGGASSVLGEGGLAGIRTDPLGDLGPLLRSLKDLDQRLAGSSATADPAHRYAYCFCDVR